MQCSPVPGPEFILAPVTIIIILNLIPKLIDAHCVCWGCNLNFDFLNLDYIYIYIPIFYFALSFPSPPSQLFKNRFSKLVAMKAVTTICSVANVDVPEDDPFQSLVAFFCCLFLCCYESWWWLCYTDMQLLFSVLSLCGSVWWFVTSWSAVLYTQLVSFPPSPRVTWTAGDLKCI